MTIKRNLSLIALLALVGCPNSEISVTDGCSPADLADPQPDLLRSAAKCAAAKGLSGDNLLCVDFDKVTSLTDPALAGWNFNALTANCWEIRNGSLQVQDFGNFKMSCGLTLKPLDFKQSDKTGYQRATLALVHRVDLSAPDGQKAQVFIDFDDEATRLIHQTTGRPSMPTLTTTTLTVNKGDLPGTLMSVYQFFLKVSAGNVSSGRPGWQIQSIAVNATQ